MLSARGEIRRDEYCLDFYNHRNVGINKNSIMFSKCHGGKGNQNWWIDYDGAIHHESGFCVELHEDKAHIIVANCSKSNDKQKWLWKKYERKH